MFCPFFALMFILIDENQKQVRQLKNMCLYYSIMKRSQLLYVSNTITSHTKIEKNSSQ